MGRIQRSVTLLFGTLAWLFLFSGLLTPQANSADAKELYLLCGAGLRQPVDELVELFRKQTGIKVDVEYGGSGKLLARYKATGKGDVFLPGSHFYVEQLEKKSEVVSAHGIVLHIPVVAVNRKRAKAINTFSDMAKPGVRVGLGDPQAMALGRTAEEVLKNSGMRAEILKNVVVRAATVKQLTLYVVMGDVDVGIIARADAFQNKDKVVMLEINRNWYTPDVVTAAVLRSSSYPGEALRLAKFLSSPKSVETFAKFGFLPVK